MRETGCACNLGGGGLRRLVSKWCTNTIRPTLETLWRIADILEVDVRELLNKTRP